MRTKITTTIEQELLNRAKSLAKMQGLEGANAIIEKALTLYFENLSLEVWEKSLPSGWIKKVVLKGDSILFENIKCRKTFKMFKPEDYEKDSLKSRGWNKI
jgi:hypothetical protein